LWNPLDYLRLLYWVFFFPQALRWYVDTFGGGFIPEKKVNWRKSWELLRQNHIQRQFFLQGLVLVEVTPLALGVIFQAIGIPINWSSLTFSAVYGIVSGVVFGMTSGVALGVTISVALGVGLSVALGVASNVASGVAFSVFLGMGSSVVALVVFVVAFGAVYGIAFGVGLSVALGIALSVGSRVTDDEVDEEANDEVPEEANFVDITKLLRVEIVGLALGGLVAMILTGNAAALAQIGAWVAIIVSGIIAGSFVILRPENWLLGLPLALRLGHHERWQFPHITLLPIPSLSSRLTYWLQRDWEIGLYNVNQLLTYTLQFIPVMRAANQVLAEIPPEQVLYRVAQLAEALHHRRLVYSVSASLLETIKLSETKTRLDTSARAAAAGFWHLHEKEPAKATEAFAVVRSLLYGEEMFALAQTLATFHEAKETGTITALQVPAYPKEPVLRPTTWKVIASLRRVVEDVQVVQRSMSRSTRAFALNRALGEITKILDNTDTLPQAERSLIVDIAQTWQKALLQVAGEVGEISITKPVSNPYVVGDPVEGNLFVGREDVLRQLEELWVMGHQLQSVVLYGHRRMGKTSILLNAANCSGSGVKVAYVNLLRLGDSAQGVGEALMAISDAISEKVSYAPPSDEDLLNLPYRTFERYLKQVETLLSGGLIIALDEFEKIEDLIEAGKISPDFMGYLRGLVQMSSKVAFAFAGLHTLEEMTADYFQPFFASVIPIHVGFLQPGATRQILANPDEDFPLDYNSEALDQIYALTTGQPYLVQLVGFQLVRRYNDYVFEQGRLRDPVFTVEDVEAVINDPKFFKRGRYYFDGVWGQAARGAPGQQGILTAIAPHPEGLNIHAIALATDIDEITLEEALKTLKRHDVVQETEGHWHIIVELFRRWVLGF
jgi:hypothetical protein